MIRNLCLAIATLFFVFPSYGQVASKLEESSNSSVIYEGKLPAGRTVTDSKGREVVNGGTNANGSLKIRYTGKLKLNASGEYEITGELSEVTNPSSQGSSGPITVNTNGLHTTVNLEKNGTDPGGHIITTINGGNATVNVSGNFNDPSIGGTGNNVNITGNNNCGSGQPGSGGNVTQGGRGNSWNSGGGNWTVRN